MPGIGTMEALTRAGFAARGILYFMIGFLAIRTGRTEDGSGILASFDGGGAKVLLAVMALGFFGYGIWRLSEALIDSEGHGSDAKGVAVRIGGVASGLIHVGLGVQAVRLVALAGTPSSSQSGTEGPAATALSLPGGDIALVAVSIGLFLTGAYQLVKAYRADFLRHLLPRAANMGWVEALGRAGYAARGIVFLIMAWFFWDAGMSEDASRAGDMGEALGSLPGALQQAVAAGLILFGVFSLVEAIYRRIHDPHVIERLQAKL